jgi:hypothetical protein
MWHTHTYKVLTLKKYSGNIEKNCKETKLDMLTNNNFFIF